jgi:hypothetical protein
MWSSSRFAVRGLVRATVGLQLNVANVVGNAAVALVLAVDGVGVDLLLGCSRWDRRIGPVAGAAGAR